MPGAHQSDMTVLTIRVQDLTEVDNLLRESQKWGTATLVSRQIILHEGPWRDQNMAIAWELYFQAQGLAPHAWCGTEGCKRQQPLVVSTQAPLKSCGQVSHEHPSDDNQHRPPEAQRRQLGGFCVQCWRQVGLRTGRNDVASIDFMKLKRVFKNAGKIDPEARLRGPVTENEFQKFVDNYLNTFGNDPANNWDAFENWRNVAT